MRIFFYLSGCLPLFLDFVPSDSEDSRSWDIFSIQISIFFWRISIWSFAAGILGLKLYELDDLDSGKSSQDKIMLISHYFT